MGKHTANQNPVSDDFELKVLIDNCNVCDNSGAHHGSLWQQNGKYLISFFNMCYLIVHNNLLSLTFLMIY